MRTFESRKSRRIVVRLDRGEELVETLEGLARREDFGAAWVRGIGSLAWVELDRHDQARKKPEPPQRFDTACELLTLEGSLARTGDAPRALLHATIARRTDNGVDVIGGRMRAAGVFAVELVIEHFADLALSRTPDDATGLALFAGEGEAPPRPAKWTAPAVHEDEEEEAPAPPSSGVSWADVAAVSAAPPVHEPPRRARSTPSAEPAFRASLPDRRAPAEDVYDDDELQPQKGDFIDHRQFGLCKIDREDEEGGLIIRLPSGIRKTIKLDFMEVGRPRMEGTRRVFPIRPRRR